MQILHPSPLYTKTLLSFLLTGCLVTATAQQTFTFGTDTNPKGRTIQVDRDGLIIDGRHAIPVMGEIHYARVPREDWRREIRKMRAGGITIVSTYVFWIHHEAEEGRWDWSGQRDLHEFLSICRDEGMPVVLRIGPFCHGEVLQGGFPSWLVSKALSEPQQYKLRSEAPGFMAATERLYRNIFAQCQDMLWKNGGTVIGLQIENECRGPWSYYKRLKEMAVSIGFDLPFYTRTGWPKLNGKEEFGQMLPLYGDYADGFWDRVLTDMPGDYAQAFVMKKDSRLSSVIATEALGINQDVRMEQQDLQYPYLTCELGGGMMPSYHRRINISGREIQPLAICKLGSGSNLPGYYMYHGGTNPGQDLAETQASPVTNYNDMPKLNYDFQAPLGEMGQPNETAWHESRWLHQFLADWGEELATMHVDSLSPQYARRGCFIFRNDYVRILHPEGSASVTFDGMQWRGMTLSSTTVQPFAKADDGLYLITVPGAKRHAITIGKRSYRLTPDIPLTVDGKTLTLLSPEKARTAYVIDGHLYHAPHAGILYKGGGQIYEEAWEDLTSTPEIRLIQQPDVSPMLREIKMGAQKVAAMPVEQDYKHACTWTMELPALGDDDFIRICYQGDVARVLADGVPVADNFWNGKPMYVRYRDLAGAQHVELQILPLGRDYPIYLQREQRDLLNAAPDGALIGIDDVQVVRRMTYAFDPVPSSLTTSRHSYLVSTSFATDTTRFVFSSVNEALLYAQRHDSDDDEWTDIRIEPGVYWIDDPDNTDIARPKRLGEPPYGLEVRLNRTRLIGLGERPEDVVLASQRGQTQGADGNFTMLHIIGDDFEARNLTFGNYCNVDLVYDRDPRQSRRKRNEAIVQAQLIICHGDRYTARDCRFISRLNLCPFAGARHADFDHCYFECTDDALCGTGVYRHCRFTFFSSKPFYATSPEGATFIDCDIHTKVRGTQYLTKVSSPVTLTDCRWTSDDPNLEIAWTPKPNPKHLCLMTGCTLNGEPYELGPTPDIPMPVAALRLPIANACDTLRGGSWTLDAYKPADTAPHQWGAELQDATYMRYLQSWAFGEGEDGAEGCFGMMPIVRGARMRYTGRDGEQYEDQSLALTLNPCKSAGQGFGSATGQYLDICIKFDTRTLTGYGLRLIRTPDYGNAVEAYLVEYDHSIVTAITEAVKCELFKRGCHVDIKTSDGLLTCTISNPSLEGKSPIRLSAPMAHPNSFGGIHIQHTGSVGASSVVISSLTSHY